MVKRESLFQMESYRERPAIFTADRVYTYDYLLGTGTYLVDHVTGRSLIFILCRNEPAPLIFHLACLQYGMVPLLLPADMEDGQLTYLRDLYRPEYIFLPREKEGLFSHNKKIYQSGSYLLMRTLDAIKHRLSQDLSLLLYRGREGASDLLFLTEKNLRDTVEALVERRGLEEDSRVITTGPMSDLYTLTLLHSHFYRGASVILAEEKLERGVFQALYRDRGASCLSELTGEEKGLFCLFSGSVSGPSDLALLP